jgi:hypothetical protein
MTKPFNHHQAETIFKALDGYDHLNGLYGQANLKVSFSELYAYAHDAALSPSETLKHALSSDLRTRRDLNRLIKRQAIAFMPRAAAASSGDIHVREGDGFKITLKTSQADTDQVYVIIESFDRDDAPTLLFIQNEDMGVLRLNIDGFYDGEAQILLFAQDDVVKALRNHASEVILR